MAEARSGKVECGGGAIQLDAASSGFKEAMTMAETKTFVANAPVWVDLSSTDADKARDYYSKLFGWKVEVAPDPDAGGHALAKLNGKHGAGLGPGQAHDGP